MDRRFCHTTSLVLQCIITIMNILILQIYLYLRHDIQETCGKHAQLQVFGRLKGLINRTSVCIRLATFIIESMQIYRTKSISNLEIAFQSLLDYGYHSFMNLMHM